jgi:hypothetical protein
MQFMSTNQQDNSSSAMNQGTGVATVLVITYTKNTLVPSWPFPQTPRGHRRKNTELNSNGGMEPGRSSGTWKRNSEAKIQNQLAHSGGKREPVLAMWFINLSFDECINNIKVQSLNSEFKTYEAQLENQKLRKAI